VQHKRICVPPQLGNDERHPLRHEAGHEGDIARQPVQLRNDDAALGRLGCSQCGCELGPAIEGIGALAGLGLDVLGDEGRSLGPGEALDGGPLGLNSETRTLLPLGRWRGRKAGEHCGPLQ
jgi:hypothetical protein